MTVWGYVLQAPRRPPVKKQLEALVSNGIDTGSFGPVWSDKIDRPKRGNGAKPEHQLLQGRSDLLKAVRPGDRVVVADPYCVGLTPDDAARFIAALSGIGASLTVSGPVFHIRPGDSAAEILAEIARRQNASYVAAYRARPKRCKGKSKSK